ncbi:MAG TPA: TonB family protein [Saprospiraceae bacterium]|nr:TonB family protein [Saprospiraceae bacterium]
MKRNLSMIVLFIPIVIAYSFGQNISKSKFKEQLENKSKLLKFGYNWTYEKIDDTMYIYKMYYPESKQIIKWVTYKSKDFSIMHGKYEERYDDGTLFIKGYYHNNSKSGEWLLPYEGEGNFKDNMKEGQWLTYHSNGEIKSKSEYHQNMLHGSVVQYDTLGTVTLDEIYHYGELTSINLKSEMENGEESMPRFPGCEDDWDNIEKLDSCSQRHLLEYIYSHLKYPKEARINRVEGSALIQFLIHKDGTVADVKVLRGLCNEISQMCTDLIENMPKWKPGYQRGEPVKVLYTLPIRFQLN